MKKRILSLLLCAAMAVTATPFSAFAADEEVKTVTPSEVKNLSTVEYIDNNTSGDKGGVRTWNDPLTVELKDQDTTGALYAFTQYDTSNKYDVPWTYVFNKPVTIEIENCKAKSFNLISTGGWGDETFGAFVFNAPLTIKVKNSEITTLNGMRTHSIFLYMGDGAPAKKWGCQINDDYQINIENSTISSLAGGLTKTSLISSSVQPRPQTQDEILGTIEKGVHMTITNSQITGLVVGHSIVQTEDEACKEENYYVKGDSTIDLVKSNVSLILSSRTSAEMEKYSALEGRLAITLDKDSSVGSIYTGAPYVNSQKKEFKTGSSAETTLTTAAPLTMSALHHVDLLNMGGNITVTQKMSLPTGGMHLNLINRKAWTTGDVLLDYTYADGTSTVDEAKVTSNWTYANITMNYRNLADENKQQWYLNVTPLDCNVTFDAGQNGAFTDAQDPHINQIVTEDSTVTGVAEITANDGYVFKGWTIEGDTSGKIYTTDEVLKLPITDHTRFVAAYDVKPTYTVTFEKGQHGVFATINDPLVNQTIDKNQSVTGVPEITANSGYRFSGWQIDGIGDVYTAEQVKAMSITANTKFIASYTKRSSGGSNSGSTSYIIKASAGNGGSISPNGNVSVSKGSNKSFAITASDGYKIADVLVDGKSVGAVSTYTFSNVREAHTITVSFTKEAADEVADPDSTGVGSKLNTKEHLAFMQGYGNGIFGPSREVTRAQVAQIFYNLLLNKNVDTTVSFSDVTDTAWYSKAVNTLASMDVIKGVGQSKFAPERAISRAEFAAIATRFAKASNNGDVAFTDVSKDAWYYNNVLTAVQYGWIDGYTDNTFKPNKTITRAESTKIVNRMLARSADKNFVNSNSEIRRFSDVNSSNWAYYEIMEAVNAHNHKTNGSMETWTSLKQ